MAAVRLVDPGERRLEPGERTFRRAVGGATPSGRVLERALVRLPGLSRTRPVQVVIHFADSRAEARVGVDGGPLESVRANRDGELVVGLPARAIPSATVELVALSTPLRIRSLTVARPISYWPAAIAFVVTALAVVAMLGRASLPTVFAFGIAVASFVALPMASVRLWVPLALLAASIVTGHRSRRYWASTVLAASFVFGLWVRVYFLPSAGSWDTEYWKAWMTRAVAEGTTRVYGDPGSVGEGEFFDKLLGRTELWRAGYHGREFVVDYPPGAMALWRWSWLAVNTLAPGLERGEAENVAVKLPSVLGDLGAVVLLLWIFRRERSLGLALAALYWATPVTWLSSAVLGFLDGAYAPLAVGALVTASAGRSGWSGALLATAALIKPQALIVAPAAAVALVRADASLRPAIFAGLGLVGAVLVPFALAGTLDEAVTHVFRILFQQRLSAGYANPWWLVGHAVSAEPFATKELVPGSSIIAVSLFTIAAIYVGSRARDASLAGGGLIFAYAMLALGVHHNHPHVMFLAFAATGLRQRWLRWLTGILAVSYVINLVCLSGLGRFYGMRYMAIESVAAGAAGLRTGWGFDLTLGLGVINTVLFAAFLVYLRRRE